MEALLSFSNFLKSNTQVRVEVRGHTITIPAEKYCDALSTERAQSVVDFLVDNGVNKDQLVAKGYGKRVPRAIGYSATHAKYNQRVDIKVLASD